MTRFSFRLRGRLQILAAMSHDLQTPIARMRLRLEAMEHSPERGKLIGDLDEMEHLVRNGVAYARTFHGASEPPTRLGMDAFLDSLVCDYLDMGRAVTLSGRIGRPVTTRPLALRRVLTNLVDNAIKYAGAAELQGASRDGGPVSIMVLDRGPGIPEDQLESVMQPFYRLDTPENRGTAGSGLGLAITRRLVLSIGGSLVLRNREGGGLQVTVTFDDIDQAQVA